jgi:hypothetical protein
MVAGSAAAAARRLNSKNHATARGPASKTGPKRCFLVRAYAAECFAAVFGFVFVLRLAFCVIENYAKDEKTLEAIEQRHVGD